MPTSRTPRIRSSVATRAAYARTNADLMVNSPDGFPSAQPPVWWVGSDQLAVTGAWNHGGLNNPLGGQVRVLPAVTRLTSLITDPLSSVPWKLAEEGFGGATLPTPRWLSDPQLLRPDARLGQPILPAVTRLPRSTFWSSWIRIAVWYGMAAMIFLVDGEGQPQAGSLRTLHPQFVRPVRDDFGTLVWEIGDGDDHLRTDRDGYLQVGELTWRLVALRDPHAPIDVEGNSINVFERHADAFGLAGEIEAYSATTFRGQGVPAGLLKVNTPGLQQEQADKLKAAWMRAHGDRKSIAVLNATTDFTPLSISPLDAALVENKRMSLADMAMSFGFDPNGALGVSLGNSATYANVQQHFARLKTDLMPWVNGVEETVSALFPVGRAVRMDFSELTRPDPADQYAALQVAVDAGLLTLDEARNILGLPPLPAVDPPPPPPDAPPPPDPPGPPPPPEDRARRGPSWLH